MDVDFVIRQLPADQPVAKLLDALAEAYGDTTVTVAVSSNLGNQDFSVPLKDRHAQEAYRRILEELRSRGYFRIKTVTFSGLPNQAQLQYHVQDAVLARVRISCPDNKQAQTEIRRIGDALTKHIPIDAEPLLVRNDLPEAWKQNLQYYEQALKELSLEVNRLAQFNTEQIKTQSEYLRKRAAEQDSELQDRRQQMDEEHAVKAKALAEREADLTKRVADFDVRESKYVRRDLLKRMEELIEKQKTVALSEKTTRKRLPTHILCILAMAIGIAVAGGFGYALMSGRTDSWYYLGPLSAGLILFGATIVYYLKWNDRWSVEHAQAEFRNMQFSADILRANWLAELLFEWDRDKEREFPPSLVDSFAVNLFHADSEPQLEHPAEALSRTLDRITKVRISAQEGIEIEKKAK